MQNCSKLLCSKYSEEKEDKNQVWYKQESGFGWPPADRCHSYDSFTWHLRLRDSKKKCVEKCIHEHRRSCTKGQRCPAHRWSEQTSRRGKHWLILVTTWSKETTVDSFSQSNHEHCWPAPPSEEPYRRQQAERLSTGLSVQLFIRRCERLLLDGCAFNAPCSGEHDSGGQTDPQIFLIQTQQLRTEL